MKVLTESLEEVVLKKRSRQEFNCKWASVLCEPWIPHSCMVMDRFSFFSLFIYAVAKSLLILKHKVTNLLFFFAALANIFSCFRFSCCSSSLCELPFLLEMGGREIIQKWYFLYLAILVYQVSSDIGQKAYYVLKRTIIIFLFPFGSREGLTMTVRYLTSRLIKSGLWSKIFPTEVNKVSTSSLKHCHGVI